MSDDTISRQAAIAVADSSDYVGLSVDDVKKVTDGVVKGLKRLPSAQPEISRIEQELHGKTPEEQYAFLYWLLLKFGLAYTDSRLAVIEWLRGEKEDGRHYQQTGGDWVHRQSGNNGHGEKAIA